MKKSMKRIHWVLILLFGVMSGCQESPPTKYVALEDVPLYGEPLDETDVATYTIKKGEVCTFGEKVANKAYQFTEVKCNGAYGWTFGSYFKEEN
jgi:hypothetical protein